MLEAEVTAETVEKPEAPEVGGSWQADEASGLCPGVWCAGLVVLWEVERQPWWQNRAPD